MSREKDLEISFLLDFYGELLSPEKREAARLYFDEDLSLAEIAENAGVTRQAVRDVIVRAGEQLRGYENALGVVSERTATQAKVEEARNLLSENKTDEAEKVLTGLLDFMQEI